MAAASAIVRAPGVGQCHRDVAARARSAPMAPRLAASRSVSLGRTAAAAIRRLPHRNAATAVAALRLPFPFGLGENQRKATCAHTLPTDVALLTQSGRETNND